MNSIDRPLTLGRCSTWWIALLLLLVAGCSDEVEQLADGADGDAPAVGSEVAFALAWPASTASATRALGTLPNGYSAITELNGLEITMKNGSTYSASANYDVAAGVCSVAEGAVPLRWQDNVNTYSFTAQWGDTDLATTQTEENWAKQDLLKGYGAVPTDAGEGVYTIAEAEESKTSKEWYQANRTWRGVGATAAECRTIPLFLKHQRAWLTVILKAGEGVKRSDLDPATASLLIKTVCFSYGSPITEITPKQGEITVGYETDANGDAEPNRSTVKYDAIVEPHDFNDAPNDDKVFTVTVSGQTFLFFASNDKDYNATNQETKEACHSKYNLEAGKHLTITATLSRDSRKVMITAYLEDWDEEVNSFVCDDFGGNGSPVVISSKKTLLEFLQGDKNKAGNVAIVGVQELDLTKEEEGVERGWNPEGLVLKSTLNLGGSTIILPNRLLESISSTGSVVGGRIEVTSPVDAAICKYNKGTISKLNVVPKNETVVATRAGIAITNHSIISSCSSSLSVLGSGTLESQTYIGGIAAESLTTVEHQAVIEDCVVYGCVDIAQDAQNIYGAGIVGSASGIVSNNTYEFGVTLNQTTRQDGSNNLLLKNIIHTKSGETLEASGNRWPTTTLNPDAGANVYPPTYEAVISNQEELRLIVDEHSSTYNQYGKKYRIACDFEVNTTTYGSATKSDDFAETAPYNVRFTLDGNGKCLTLKAGALEYTIQNGEGGETTETLTTAPMLFSNITGKVENLNIHLMHDIKGVPDGQSTDVAAPLAYSVTKDDAQPEAGQVTNVHVTAENDVKVAAAGPSGLVVWGYKGALLTSCSSAVNVELSLTTALGDGDMRYAGGLLSQADDVTLDRCHFDGRVSCPVNPKRTFFLGGLVGGVDVKMIEGVKTESNEMPHLTLTDCYSRFQPESTSCTVGSVLGRSYYPSGETKTHGVVSSACQGNWWYDGTTAVGAKNDDYKTDEKVLGKRNSVQPF